MRGVDDASVDGAQPFTVRVGPAQSADPTYSGLDPVDVAVTNNDNDVLAACSPRPPVTVSTVRTAPGQLQVTVRATSNHLTPNNRLAELRFKAPAGISIDMAGTAGRTGTFSVPLPYRPTASSFTARVTTPSPMTVPFEVVDDCGAWPTCVGDGGQ